MTRCSNKHMQGKYDRVHCGAACPPQKLAALLELVRPEGGLVVTPVEPSDLRVIVKAADGTLRQRIVSQVRYSTLEVHVPLHLHCCAVVLNITLRVRHAKSHCCSISSFDHCFRALWPRNCDCGS